MARHLAVAGHTLAISLNYIALIAPSSSFLEYQFIAI